MERVLKVKILSPMLEKLDNPATEQSACIDLRACIEHPITILPHDNPVIIPSGVALEISDAETNPCMILMFGRSGLGAKHGITLANCVGVFDSDYRGEYYISLVNHSNVPYTISPLDRIAQIVCVPIERVKMEYVDELSETSRGTGGFGSTGKS